MNRQPTSDELHGAILGLGATSIVGSVLGFLPTASFSQNVGIVTTTKVINRATLALAAIIILIAGIVPKFSGLLTTIPYAVLGGATIPVFASIAMTGIKLALSDGATPRNMAIVGLAVAMGMGLSAARNHFTFSRPGSRPFSQGPGRPSFHHRHQPQPHPAKKTRFP